MSISSVVTKIGNAAKGISNRKLEISSKALGAFTMGSIIYDTHVNGKEKALSVDIVETADRYDKNYKQYMNMSTRSQTIADFKRRWFDMQQSFTLYHVLSKLTGYFYGATQTILSNLPETGLSILALKTRKHPVLGKTAGVLLGINLAKTVLHDVIGIGSKN